MISRLPFHMEDSALQVDSGNVVNSRNWNAIAHIPQILRVQGSLIIRFDVVLPMLEGKGSGCERRFFVFLASYAACQKFLESFIQNNRATNCP